MRSHVAHAVRSLFALVVFAPAFVACQADKSGDPSTVPSASSQLSEAEAARAGKEGECGPGETVERVCKEGPDGQSVCEVVCVPATPNGPECDPGTHPVKACKPAEGADDECFLICLPDEPPPVEPTECKPGTHPEVACDAPGPWPVPPFPGDPRDPKGGDGGGEGPRDPQEGNGGGEGPRDPSEGNGGGYGGGEPGGECQLVCVPDEPPFPTCPPGTGLEKVCRLDPATGQEECFLECLPGDDPGPGPGPGCPDGSEPRPVCKEGPDGTVECELTCGPQGPDAPPPPPQPYPLPEPRP